MPSRSRSRSRDRRDRHRDSRVRSRSLDRDDERRHSRDMSRDRDRDRDHKRYRDRSRDDKDSERYDRRDRDRDRERDSDRSRRPKSDQEDRHSRDKERSSRRRRDSGSEDDRDRGRSSHSSSSKKKSKRDHEESSKKARETSEERAIRKAQRKKEKEEQQKQLEVAMTNYSNSDNPFNDANLAQKFTWTKKREVEKKKGISGAESARRDIIRREEARLELEKLTKKRAEREREREEREEELIRIQRASEQAQLGDWQAQEEEFHLKQAKRRAEIRIKSNRAKPIDILATNIKLISENDDDMEEDEDDIGLEIDVEEPYTIFDNLSLDEVQELFHDIKFYLSLDKDENSVDFWRAMLIVCEDKISELDPSRAEQGVLAPRIAEDIAAKLAGKSYEELTLLQGQIQRKLGAGGAIDVDYWEALLKTLIVWKAKAKLNMIHQVILQKRLEQLKTRQLREAEKEKAELAAVLAMQSQDVEGDISALREARDEDMEEASGDVDDDMNGLTAPTISYDRAMSPEPFDTLSREDQSLAVLDQWEDWADILDKRRQVLNKQFNPKKRNTDQDMGEQHPDDDFVAKLLFDKEAAKQMAGDEETFNMEAALQRQQTYLWQDKYRPRKPRFFNRVHTGYEWNKYNQTHYDHDNPPPKVVQGYKFNLFYPDLIDKSQAPTYEIIKEPGTEDTVLIKFKSGPPYEDIAFRIVNREWEHSHKKGYKSVFDRGVLQLHFNFKRQFYRR
ncbi:hypothetical protein BGZ50_004778 [Haplosporangium sp. Z 11]|nr:hypothetical protein BGZ50_004778 [Haplosporangium sp. Z 11]